MEGSGQNFAPAALLPGKEPPVGGWVSLRATDRAISAPCQMSTDEILIPR